MKQVLAVSLALVAGTVSADQSGGVTQYHVNQGLGAGGEYTLKSQGSFYYEWNHAYSVQADVGITRMESGTGGDNSLGAHASFNLTNEFTLGAFVGWEGFADLPDDYYFHGVEIGYQAANTNIQLFTRRQSSSFLGIDNVAYGGNAEIYVNDQLTLVGRGILQDNDGTDRFTTLIAAGIDYTLMNGVTLSGELATWDKKLSWSTYDSGQSISLGAKYYIGGRSNLFADRSTVSALFGSDLLPIY